MVPGYSSTDLLNQAIYLTKKTDSLENELELNNKFYKSIESVLSGRADEIIYKDTLVLDKNLEDLHCLIEESHHTEKIDKPSGTAIELNHFVKAADRNQKIKSIETISNRAKNVFGIHKILFYNNTKARDGEINLDSIVKLSKRDNILKGQNDIINMFFVNAIDGDQGPTGRGMMNGNIVFIALADENNTNAEKQTSMEAFVIAHEVGHNLGLKHVVDDDNIIDSLPNIQGDGEFKDRIDPKNSLNPYQINEIYKSPLVHSRINFLDKEQASIAILDESFEPYFSKLQRKEISTFVQEKAPKNIDSARAFARIKFSSAVMEFSSREKDILSFVVKKTNSWLLENEINLMANQPWRFIKIQNWLCGGFAHTRGTYIILSQSYLDRLSAEWSDNMSDKSELKLVTSLGGLLVHEQMHSLQRTFKSRFDKLYSENWNFIKQQIKDDNDIIKDQLSLIHI